MEVVSKQSFSGTDGMQFGPAPESLPNWGLPFCMELRFVFETHDKRHYILDPAGVTNLGDLMMDGLPEPTVLIVAAELVLALEGLHELGVSYNELDLNHATVDSEGHVVLWREFEGKEYWHISECICGVLDGNCEKIGHKIKRRGTNIQPGQRHWEEIFLGAQDDWKSLGILLCQLLTGQVDFLNFQSLEQAIITLFITPTTKDFLYSLVTGALHAFEDLKCHPCFDGLDWDEVKSKSFPSPLMASYRSRLHSAPSRSFSKSPSLQNVYTAGISARQERGMFAHSPLSRTRSTSELHSTSSGKSRPSLSTFNRSASERRNTLCVPFSGSGQSRPDKETSLMMLGNRNKQDGRNFSCSHVGMKSNVRLHRQLFDPNSRNFEPQCVSAPSSPRQSVDTGLNDAFLSPKSAPTSPQGSGGTLHSDNTPSPQSQTTNGVFFNHPETNPFHEGYRKRWGSVAIDTAYGIYSSHLALTNDDNNNATVSGNSSEMANTNQLKSNSVYDNYSRDLNDYAYGSTSAYGRPVSRKPNTYATANVNHSPVFNQNGDSVIPERATVFTNSDNASTIATEMTQPGPQSRRYSMEGSANNNTMYNYSPRISPNDTGTARLYDCPVIVVQRQSQDMLNNVNTSGPNSPGNVGNLERNFSFQNISDNQHQNNRRPGSTNLQTTNEVGHLRSPNAYHASSQPTNPFDPSNNDQFQKRRESINPEISDGTNVAFFQTSSNDPNFPGEQNTPKETADILFQKYFRSRRGSAEIQTPGKISSNSGSTDSNVAGDFISGSVQVPLQTRNVSRTQSQFGHGISTASLRNPSLEQSRVESWSDLRNIPRDEVKNNFSESIQPRGAANNFTREQIQEKSVGRDNNSFSTTTNNFTPPNSPFQKRSSVSPEPVVAIHPSINVPKNSAPNTSEMSALLSSDADEFNRFQQQSQRRRSSTDVASLSSHKPETSKPETPSRKLSLSRSRSYSNIGKSFGATKNDRTNEGQVNNRRSTTLKPIPSFEEFRMMRALSKMADGERNDDNSTQKGGNHSSTESRKEKKDHHCEKGQNTDNNSSSNLTNTSHTNNIVIQDLLAKYGLDKNPCSSTVKPHQNASHGPDYKERSSPTPSSDTLRATTTDSTDTKQRLLNILDDFLAVRTKQKILRTSCSMHDLKTVNSSRHQRRPSLREENLSNSSRDCSQTVCETTDLNLTTESRNRSDPESSRRDFTGESADPKSESCENTKYDTNSSDQLKRQNTSKGNDRRSYSQRSRRKSKRTKEKQGSSSEVQKSESEAISRTESEAKISVEKSNGDIHQSAESVVSTTADVDDTREREESRRVSEKAGNVARKHTESLELGKKSGKKDRKERRGSFTQAVQSKNKGSVSKQEEQLCQENSAREKQPVGKSEPVKGNHSVEVVSEGTEQKDMKYQRLKTRRTSSLLSLTDDVSGNFDEFNENDAFPRRHESLSEFKDCNSDHDVGRGDSFLSVDTEHFRRSQACRTESNSSFQSHCSFHSNFSADSGSVQLDFEDSDDDDDDDLFYLTEPQETDQKSETDIQRNDSGLGDEIGARARAKKRWQDLGHVGSRQSMVVATFREMGAKKEKRVKDEQEVMLEEGHEIQPQKQERKVSRDRRISRQRQPNAIDCPDCGRAFVVESDKPSVKSQGPKQTLICYKCQNHRVERREAIVELVQTETNYGNDFQIIKEEFLSPMQTGGIISPDNLAKIFLNIQELFDVSTKFCKKIQISMEECINNKDEELCHMNVGKIFIENLELLQAYELYCSRQPEAMTLLESLQKKNEVLRVFLNITCRENPKCRKMDINSFLMAPVQRVTKYPLLLSRIRRATPRWHDDREDLKLAQRKVEEQIAKINSLTKSSETKAKKIQSNLGSSDSVDSSRLKKLASDVLAWTLDEMQLLMHGQLKVLCSEFGGAQSWTKRAMKRNIETHLLFCIRGQNEPIKVDSEEDDDRLHFPDVSEISDASLLLLKRKSNGKYTLFRDEVKLRDCVVYGETEPHSFGLIHMGKESFQFTARTSKDAHKWIKYLKLQTKDQGNWRRRRNASANIMLKTS